MSALLPGVTAVACHPLLASMDLGHPVPYFRECSQTWNTLVLPWADAGWLPASSPSISLEKVLISLAFAAECFNPSV